MHEMALCQALVQIVVDAARREGAARVAVVRVELGALSHAEPEALAFCFPAASRGTIAEGARLELLRVPGEAWCMTCVKPVPLASRYDPCPHCGGHRLRVTAGEEMRVRDMEVV